MFLFLRIYSIKLNNKSYCVYLTNLKWYYLIRHYQFDCNMKLQCDVEVVCRAGGGGATLGPRGRPLKSTLAVGQEPKHDYFIIHFSSQHKHGNKYKVKQNIQQVFTKFCHEGKATIRFLRPENDLIIKKSDPQQLKSFLKCLKLILEGKIEGLKLFNLSNISVTSVKPPQTKLSIADASQYPLKGLPRSLEQLDICGIGMHTFRREILSLKSLKYLDLRGNRLQKLPKEFGTLPNLIKLNLSGNQLGCAEEPDWRWLEVPQVCKKLAFLNLNNNDIGPNIPFAICRLQNLTTLHLEDNRIAKLPHGLSKMGALRFLYLSQNKLGSLPGSIRTLNLDELDVSGNLSNDQALNSTSKEMIPSVGSLVEISGAVVLNQNIYYEKGMIPLTLVHYLNTTKFCVCGRATFNKENCVNIKYSIKNLFRCVIFDSFTEEMPLECYFCSYKCCKNMSTFF